MGLPKSKNAVGLGNSLMNDRFGKGKGQDMRRGNHAQEGGIQRTGVNGEKYITNAKKDASWVKMRSVTEQAALDEFLSTAELAGTDFTAEKMSNVKIIHRDQKNPFLLSAHEERAAVKKHKANRQRLTVPRRPKWDENTTPQELDEMERSALLEWRRGLAELQENDDLLMTPFERNIEVWRQLWRVIERSDLIVQIVDARNPLLFRCEDLENYVCEVDPRKNNLLLVNKADMMTLEQRQEWADYFTEQGINFVYFSAELAKETNEIRDAQQSDSEDESDDEEVDAVADTLAAVTTESEVDTETEEQKAEAERARDDPTRILTTEDLEEIFLRHAPEVSTTSGQPQRKLEVGLVGYPNVGKSSTINALIGAKKVSVSATPGKTKHFQTIHLSEQIVLCDCPGLVFPNFATTKAELVCSGVLPIDQLREFTGPAALVARRIPQSFLEVIYGMKIHTRTLEEGGTGIPTAEELLRAYAIARGFSTSGLGQPDESRGARYILKDYVKGKLLFCHPPPREPPIDPLHFNRELYDEAHLPERRRAAYLKAQEEAAAADADPEEAGEGEDGDMVPLPFVQGEKSLGLDARFFARGQTDKGRMKMPFSYKYTEQGKLLTGRKERELLALERDIDPAELKMGTKKHFKGNKKKSKTRTEYLS
ncbi:P-loop containing nucleoside triphosphate hydrolase protein [Trichodelitschia bisporula]|uniref:P-loop containing nucleoside triphosphate hydrolase protein n=1 Tax=Trichodelitschia bisporula TaxID=703511 RepID=A0A6G1I546_9PEZI|nr:P-loop containing nucleoside triphosphate hydrolase protein [Trichodelitschia bisporula]